MLEQFFIDVVRENNRLRESSLAGALDVSMVDNIGDIVRHAQTSLAAVQAQSSRLQLVDGPGEQLKTSVVDASKALELLKYKHRVDELELKVGQLTEEFNQKLHVLKSANKDLKRKLKKGQTRAVAATCNFGTQTERAEEEYILNSLEKQSIKERESLRQQRMTLAREQSELKKEKEVMRSNMNWLICTGLQNLKEVLRIQNVMTQLDETRGSFSPDDDRLNA